MAGLGVGVAADVGDARRRRARAEPSPAATYKPTKRGGGGALKLLFWQGPTLLNPHFATGAKDLDGARLFYESLVRYDADANLGAGARRRDPEPRQRRHRRRWAIDDLEAEEGREVARRPAVHGRRRDLQLDLRDRSGDGGRQPRQLRGSQGGHQDRRRDGALRVQQADADLGAHGDGPADTEAPVRGLRGRQVARRAGQPEAGRHRTVSVRRLQARRPRARRHQHRATTRRTGRTSTASSSRAAATRPRPRAPCCRPANTTSAGTCRSKTRC